ncbi:MAG: twin-arginine translocation signal domain-containing protein [Bradymonadaceae bacterium]
MRRRDFLKLAGLGSATAGLGAFAYRVGGWWNQPTASDRRVLSRTESTIAEAIADALFPGEPDGLPAGSDVDVVDHLDSYLDAVDDRTSQLLRLLLHIIDDVSIFGDLSLTRFRHRPRDERIAILRRWDESPWMVRRRAFRGLKLILAGGYCSSTAVLETLGYHFRCEG